MGQEFFINSSTLEDKIRQILPSQGGLGAGFDLSASTQIIPIVDLTESAEGSTFRQDLQSALSHKTITTYRVVNATSTIISNTGYWRLFGAISTLNTASTNTITMSISDGATDKIILDGKMVTQNTAAGNFPNYTYDFIVFLPAGHSVKAESSGVSFAISGCFRQIADIDGNLTNP